MTIESAGSSLWSSENLEPRSWAGLHFSLVSYADYSMDDAREIARVFDAYPEFRPLRMGGDPARIVVHGSLEDTVAKRGLPIEWLTEWRDVDGTRYFGEIDLFPGRGGYVGRAGEPEEFILIGHKIDQTWPETTVVAQGGIDRVVEFFEALAVASNAAYGLVSTLPTSVRIMYCLPGVFWLNYFGPAFVSRAPGLSEIEGARTTPRGGVVIRTATRAWAGHESEPELAARVRTLFPDEAFSDGGGGVGVPSIDEHLAAAGGTLVMPWEVHRAARASALREKKYSKARAEIMRAVESRPAPELNADAGEWSASFDLGEGKRFLRALNKKLGGELAGPLGKALISVVETAPQDAEDHVLVNTDFGTVRIGWFIDDVETVDVYVFGSPEVCDFSERWHEKNIAK